MLASIRISERSGFHTLAELIILAPLSVLLWNYNGNLTPYAVLQFGGIIIIVLTLLLTKAQKQSPCFASLIILYGFAKLETNTHRVPTPNVSCQAHNLLHIHLTQYCIFRRAYLGSIR